MSNPASSSRSTPHPPSIPTRSTKSNSQMYVLSADGSRLYLLDPSTPGTHEDPPAYSSISSPRSTRSVLPVSPIPPGEGDTIGVEDRLDPASPRSVRVHTLPPSGRSSASLGSQRNGEGEGSGRGRQRAYTTTAAGSPGRLGNTGGYDYMRPSTGRDVTGRAGDNDQDLGEETPLLGLNMDRAVRRRSLIRTIFCGEIESTDEGTRWKDGWRRFWGPVNKRIYWKSVLHLLILNFPFALVIWPFLFAGTVAGTALLITLPIGTAVWWSTLILARTAARIEISLQTHHHQLPNIPPITYHPIFHRQLPNPPIDAIDEPSIIWEKGFIKCSYAMFCDYYSYSSLSYFVLLKPLITLFSTIAIIALFPIALVTVFGLPIYLRAMRRWGIWQARFAITNLQ